METKHQLEGYDINIYVDGKPIAIGKTVNPLILPKESKAEFFQQEEITVSFATTIDVFPEIPEDLEDQLQSFINTYTLEHKRDPEVIALNPLLKMYISDDFERQTGLHFFFTEEVRIEQVIIGTIN